jgi:putative ABC transport system ATP-binding protein
VPPPPLLTVSSLTKRFGPGQSPVLEGLELTLHAGQYLAIMGESGAGKSTLLNLIAGLDRAEAGHIRLEGVELDALDDDARSRLRRSHLGFVFQAFHVLPYLTVLQNVTLPLELLGLERRARQTRAHQWLERCGIDALAMRYPRELSGGELQRTAIARALVHEPRLLLADEPTGNLDAGAAAQILQLLSTQVHAAGAGAILITHSLAAARTADRILRLEGGRLTPAAPEARLAAEHG